MCLILLGWRALPDFPLIVAANRDEFHSRPTAAAGFWSSPPGILAGRDLEAGGTWMGVARDGRFAAVTNYRGASEPRAAESRGALVTGFLDRKYSSRQYMTEVEQRASSYSGFNLLACDGEELWWMSNRGGGPRRLAPGVYGLGNALLDDPEVDAAKARFRASVEPAPAVDTLFGAIAESRIVNPQYGTRCSTIFLQANGKARYAERTFHADGAEADTVQFEFAPDA